MSKRTHEQWASLISRRLRNAGCEPLNIEQRKLFTNGPRTDLFGMLDILESRIGIEVADARAAYERLPLYAIRKGRGSRGRGVLAALEIVRLADQTQDPEKSREVICTLWYNAAGWTMNHQVQAEAILAGLEAL